MFDWIKKRLGISVSPPADTYSSSHTEGVSESRSAGFSRSDVNTDGSTYSYSSGGSQAKGYSSTSTPPEPDLPKATAQNIKRDCQSA